MNATTARSIAAGTIRLVRGVLTAAFTWIAVIGATAQAGDRAQSHVIGFSLHVRVRAGIPSDHGIASCALG